MSFSEIGERRSTVFSESSARVESADLIERQSFYFAGTVCCSAHIRIVHHDGDSIRGDPNIQLDCVCTRCNSLCKRLQRVFGSVRAIAAMPDYRASASIQQDVHL
jgi:hypothetical protein